MARTPEPGRHPNGDPIVTGVVQATGTIAFSDTPGLGEFIEAAMHAATEACYEAGVTDPAEILAAKNKAHVAAIEAWEARPVDNEG